MLNRKEILLRNLSEELRYICKAVDQDRLHQMYPQQSCIDVIADKLVFATSHGKHRNKDISTSTSLREHNYFKLAQVLQTECVKDYTMFKEEVRRKIPEYRKNPRVVLKFGNIPWKLNFELPDLIHREYAKKKETPKPEKPVTESKPEISKSTDMAMSRIVEVVSDLKNQVDKLTLELDSLRVEVNDNTEALQELKDYIATHQHDEKGVYIKRYLTVEEDK